MATELCVLLLRSELQRNRQLCAKHHYHEAERVYALRIAPPRFHESLIRVAGAKRAKVTHSLPRG